MYGRRASQLLRELASCETGQLTAFNTIKVFDNVFCIPTFSWTGALTEISCMGSHVLCHLTTQGYCDPHIMSLDKLISTGTSIRRQGNATGKETWTLIFHGYFRKNAFDEVIKECGEHDVQLQELIRKIRDENLDVETTRNEDHYGAVVHHLSLLRNKRCLMAYMYNRAEIIQSLRWKIGCQLPDEIRQKCAPSEIELFKNHSAAIEHYMSELEVDLTLDMVPPKDPYIQVKVLDDVGVVCLDQDMSLTKHSVHLVKRADAEPMISKGEMEEFME